MFFRRFSLLLALVWLSALAFSQSAPPKPTLDLPKAFGGWVMAGAPTTPQLTGDQQALLKEFGVANAEEARYQQNGRTLDLTIFQFPDVTGSYGAFTFWHEPNMILQKIGDAAFSGNDRVIFFRGNILVDAKFDRVNAMTLSQLRELSRALPVLHDPGKPPALPRYLPAQNYVEGTTHYAVGPVGVRLAGAAIDPEKINFSFSPEIVTGSYNTNQGQATITLISYPTPQIAGEQLKLIQPAFVNASTPGNQVKRTGSILVLTSGQVTADEAKTLLASVNYDADLTWDEPTKLAPRDNVFGLLANIVILSGILIAFMLFIGLFFGGFRILYYKLNPQKAAQHEEEQQLIRLNLQ
jgi:hypothetical protein